MIPAVWTFAIMYSLGALLYLSILESTDEADPHSDVRLALLWPYVACGGRIIAMQFHSSNVLLHHLSSAIKAIVTLEAPDFSAERKADVIATKWNLPATSTSPIHCNRPCNFSSSLRCTTAVAP